MTYLPNQSYIQFILASMLVILTLGLPFDSTTPISTTQSPVLYHNASHYCSQFDQCESCLKDHSQITNATRCSYKICVQPANDRLKSFPVCFPTDEDVPCPGNMQYMKKFDGIEGCSTIQQTGKDGAPTPAPTPVTPANNTTIPTNTTTTTPSVPTNVTTPIVPVNPNSTTITPPSNATTIPSPTTTNTTTSVKPTTPPITTAITTAPANKTTTGSPITLSTTTIRPVPTSTSRFSPSSFVGGMCLMAGIATLFYFGIKYYRSNVSRYRQF